ncbi:hypothetical protein LEP1GSC070_2156 [Leptospira santarosai str. AIM]|nr:hypothetical protein LEP1GSC070_2156 [Leptospira santarosai str. AIM]
MRTALILWEFPHSSQTPILLCRTTLFYLLKSNIFRKMAGKPI